MADVCGALLGACAWTLCIVCGKFQDPGPALGAEGGRGYGFIAWIFNIPAL